MNERQRQATVEMMHAILAVQSCPPDIRFRAESLLARVSDATFTDMLRDIAAQAHGGSRS